MDTLVLSASYEPVARVSWRRAITLLFAGKVEVVEEYEDQHIRTVTLAVRMPAVVRFLKNLAGRRRAVKFSRENVYARDHGRCQYCGAQVAPSEATYDHVVPRSRGGRTAWENVVIACTPCNQKKGCRTPEQARMHLQVAPVRPKKLPELRLTLRFQRDMPAAWRSWLPVGVTMRADGEE
ncbi:MAG TPA: HNH endonuclease [Myxococcales bacterium]|jgi:5-methylcytosine-specific restriction endonuclease McrA